MKQALQFALRGYKRMISPMLPHACRFIPTCSEYALEAIERHGARRGSWLALKRLSRCHPFAQAGVDLVPPKAERRGMAGSGAELNKIVVNLRDLDGNGHLSLATGRITKLG
jgi:putative membrane protein insertion efficiency factor